MLAILERISDGCNYVIYELSDDRTRYNWPGIGTLLTILFSYLYFCKKAGPAWMKDRNPYDLTRVIFYYNIFQVFISAYIFYEGCLVYSKYNWACQPVMYENIPEVNRVHNVVWLYSVLKLIELLDTLFFVLRKKSQQISNLHLYHHFIMPITAYVGYKYYPNGHSLSLGVINCFVHMVMYTYYLIASLGPQYQIFLWWKKYVTILQIVQFFIIFIHNLVPLINGCSYPKWINVILIISAMHFVYMFSNFYYVNYVKIPNKTVRNTQKIKY